jgi:hypothetical protein
MELIGDGGDLFVRQRGEERNLPENIDVVHYSLFIDHC